MLSKIKHKTVLLLQFVVVLVYIIFEELIWESISRPIYEFIHSLRILQRVEVLLHSVNAYAILVLFVAMFASVESLGIYAGLLFVSGKVWHGLVLYFTKIPVAAFTFWMFRVTEDKLMQFGWFRWLYGLVMRLIKWLKSTDIYVAALGRVKILKSRIKDFKRYFKEKYLSKESRFVQRIKSMYMEIKKVLGRYK